MSDNKFEQLIAAWFDGRINTEESELLQCELWDSAEARTMFRQYAQLDAALCEAADSGRTFDTQSQNENQPGVKSVQRIGQAPLPGSRIVGWFAAIAVGLLLVIGLYNFPDSAKPIAQTDAAAKPKASDPISLAMIRRPPAPVATVSSASNASWEKLTREVGSAIAEGETISLRKGQVRISVGCGAEIIADAPCSMTFASSDRVRLHQGVVAIDVAPWAKGFTVQTDDMDIVDLGTTFMVSAVPGSKSEATVLKGVVRVHSSTATGEQQRGLLVTEGQQVSTDGLGSFNSIEQGNAEQLQRVLDFGVTGPYRPVALNNTGIGLAAGDEDLHWRVTAGLQDNFNGPQYATVCVPHQAYLPNDPQKSQWVSILDWETAFPNTTYTFEAEFSLEGYDLSTMQLFGRFLADNGISAVRVNGKPVQVKSWVDNVKYQPFGDPQFRFVNVTEGLVNGRNVIEVDVRNGMMRRDKMKDPPMRAIPNPMALRVEWYAFGRQLLVEEVGENATSSM